MSDSGTIVIAGGTGFLGRSLARRLIERGRAVVLLGRTAPADDLGGARFARWDGRSLGDWIRLLDGAAAVVNLAGRTVDCIKTPEREDEILRSRVEATAAIGRAMREVAAPPPVWIQMSTAHIYGDPPECVCDESSAFGVGLAPMVGQAWEREHADGLLPSQRSVVLRTSFVLGRSGGALPRLAKLARALLGGRIGHGRQGMSWIHERDMNRIFERALTDEGMRGAYLATAPNPVGNAVFMRALRRALGVPFGLPAARWMVRIGAPLLMRTDPDLAILGRYCEPRRLLDEGFAFDFDDVETALRDLLRTAR